MSRQPQLPPALAERLRAGRFPNALILTGEGRAAAARRLTMAYLCAAAPAEIPCGHCLHCRKAAAGIHPDVSSPGAGGGAIKMETLRRLRREAHIRPNEAQRKLFLLPAEQMSPGGQNLLLKLLEEGPEYAAFFLEAAAPEALLPTVRSRCELVRWQGDEAPAAEAATAPGALAQRFAALLSEGADAAALLEFLVQLEGKTREELRAMLEACRRLLLPLVAAEGPEAPRLLAAIETLSAVRAAAESNISPGHLAGMLMAKLL